MTLRLVPLSLKAANELVADHHRHARPARGCIAVVGLADGTELVGAAIIGRPVARALQDGFTAEVTRLVVIGEVPNGCSMLYGAAWRAARALGYTRLVTYTLQSESGASLRAAGWRVVAESSRGQRANPWTSTRETGYEATERQLRFRWEAS